MGAPAVAENVKQLRGTVRKDRKVTRPAFVKGEPESPEWLNPEARAEWDRVMPDLVRNGLALADRAALARYCDAHSRWVGAAQELDGAASPVAKDYAHTGVKKHPVWQIWVQAGAAADRFAIQLGLTPASRGRMQVPGGDEAHNDLLD